MQPSELIIGRQVEKNDFQVDEQYTKVGRKHARVFRKSDGMYIEDLDSKNGTFVNGKSIKRKKITASDKVMLGGLDHYPLNVQKLSKLLPMTETEFQTAFQKLQDVYNNYQKDKVRIQSKSQSEMMLKRSLPMAIPGLLMLFLQGNPTIRIVGGLFAAGAVAIGSLWASKSIGKIPELLNNLREQFLHDYVCPNCAHDFGERPWENIRKQGRCKGCGREFQ